MLRLVTPTPVKAKFTEWLGETRYVSVDVEKDVIIADRDNRGKRALLMAQRWICLVERMADVDSAVERAITLKPTQFKVHLGQDWYVSISDTMPFVDVRRWYQKADEVNLRPTLVGIALTFEQWDRLKEIAKMDKMMKEFEGVECCWHPSSRDAALCSVCTTPTAESCL